MHTKRRLLIFLLTAGLGLASASAAPQPPRNLGLAAFSAVSHGQTTLFAALERGAGVDLNGDGDAWDAVLHVRNGALGTTTNVGLAASAIQFDGRYAAFLVSERSQGTTDLNGDGDAFDNVLFVHDVALGKTRNLGIASVWEMSLSDGLLATRVPEFSQGGQDLNGDGDAFDLVLHLHDARRATTRNMKFAAYTPKVDRHLVAFSIFEGGQGGNDLNGDGDALDSVMHVHDLATRTTHNTGLAGLGVDAIDDGRVLFRAQEASQGADLNGDGDIGDLVSQTFVVQSGKTANLGLACFGAGVLDQGIAAVFVSEFGEGRDLNGDGDTYDNVLTVWDTVSGGVKSTGLATYGSVYVEDRRVAFVASEFFQGGRDLNGDGDATDSVVLVHDVRNGAITPIAAGSLHGLVGSRVVLSVSERGEGGADRNGDGDLWDAVLHVHDGACGKTTNLGTATQGATVGASHATVLVPEAGQGGQDLNGDGDALDGVVHVLALPEVQLGNLGVAGTISQFKGPGTSMVAFGASEYSEGRDLNGDGDTWDIVVHTTK